MTMAQMGLLAALPDPGWYLHPAKIVAVLLCFGIWLLCCQWSNRDARLVNTQQTLWNGIVFGTGTVGLLLWLFMPLFGVGLVVFLLIAGGGVGAYVVHRNSLVVDQAKVLTPGHLSRLLAAKRGEKAQQIEELVRLTDWDGRHVAIPEDMVERQQYRLVQDLIADALWRRASDVDMIVTGQQTRVAYRIDGVSTERDPVPTTSAELMLRFLKKAAGLDPEEHRRPQSGHITAARAGGMKDLDKMVKIEIKSSGSTSGERLMLRVLAEESRFKIDDLGLTPPQLKQFQKVVAQPRGIVLCCGPRHTGLTSTLYAILRSHDAFMANIHTLELQRAMELENITQNIYDSRKKEVSFARRLQTILRSDPDVVMVATVPDGQTAALACEAAAQRTKLYLGMGAGDCMAGLQQWLSLVEDPKLVATTLLAVSAQRLVRRLCPECRQAYRPDPATLRKANIPADQIEQFFRRGGYLLDKKGQQVLCETCQGTGYFGRTAVFELLVVDSMIAKLIAGGTSISQIKAASRKSKSPMLYLQEQGIRKVIEGTTSINEIIRVTREEPARA